MARARARGPPRLLRQLAADGRACGTGGSSTGSSRSFRGSRRTTSLRWGWRIPFLVSVVLVGVGTFIRVRLCREPRVRARSRRAVKRGAPPIVEVLKNHRRSVLASRWGRASRRTPSSTSTRRSSSPTPRAARTSQATVLTGVVLASGLDLVAIPLFGHLSDVGRRPVYMFGAAFSVAVRGPVLLAGRHGTAGNRRRARDRRRRDGRARRDVRAAGELLLGAVRGARSLQRRVARVTRFPPQSAAASPRSPPRRWRLLPGAPLAYLSC